VQRTKVLPPVYFLAALVVPVVLAVLLYLRFIRFQERALEQTFGDDYRAYKARVRRWL